MRRLPALLLTLLPALAPLPAAAADTVAEKVFGASLMQAVTGPAVLRYRYAVQGSGIKEPVTGPVVMEVKASDASGGREVFLDMLDGPNRRRLGPIAAREQNPLVIVFLQRDVNEMGNLTGGSAGYFQQQIRRAFSEPAEVSAVEVEVAGRKAAATRVLMRPFGHDPHLDRFPQFKDKAYEFVVSEAVPGGVYRLASLTPDPTGRLVLEESMTFESAAP